MLLGKTGVFPPVLYELAQSVARLLQEGLNLHDDAEVSDQSDLQLVLLPLTDATEERETALFNAAASGEYAEVEKLLFELTDPDAGGFHESTAIASASYFGHQDVVRLLLEAGAAHDTDYFTPLAAACCGGQEDVARLLVEASADTNTTSYRGTPLTWAAYNYGRVEIVRLLLQARAEANKLDEDGYTPLAAAFQQQHLGVMSILLESRADVDLECPALGKTLLCSASSVGDRGMVRRLLKARADKNRVSAYATPLTWAAHGGHAAVVRTLLRAQADIEKCVDSGYTSLTAATDGQWVEVVDLLLENHADVNVVCPVTKKTPLCLAADSGCSLMVQRLVYHGADKDWVPRSTCIFRMQVRSLESPGAE